MGRSIRFATFSVVSALLASNVSSFSHVTRTSILKHHYNEQPKPLSLRSQQHRTSAQTGKTRLQLADTMSTIDVSSMTIAANGILTNENIKVAFNVATFLPQPFWLLLILLPKSDLTKKIMGGMEIVTLFALVHFFIVVASAGQPDGTAPIVEFNDVFDPSGDPQKAMIGMMRYPNFVSEEWSHVLTWDLFVGRWIWLDGLKRGIFTSHSVLLSNLIGPPGLLLHFLTCSVTGKGVTPNEAPFDEEE